MLPLAPGLLSTMTDAPERSPSLCPARRARMSGPVPRENGTTMLMILPGAGYEGCACAAAAGKSRATASVECQENFAVSTCSGAREESERPRLDALARRRARRRGRIDERAVRGEARATVLGRIVYLEDVGLVARAQRVVEDDDARGTRDFLHQRLDLGIVHALQLLEVEEIVNSSLVIDELEAGHLEVELARERPAVADRHLTHFVLARDAAADVVGAESLVHRFHAGVDGVVQAGGHRGSGSK